MQKRSSRIRRRCMRPTWLAEWRRSRSSTARIIDAATLDAWRRLTAAAAAAAVADGNRTLLFREQHDIIDRFYVLISGHRWPLGPAFTYLLTLAGTPSIPGARSYPGQYPLRVDARLPRITVSARTPLAD